MGRSKGSMMSRSFGLRGGLSSQKEIVDRVVDEFAEALEVLLVDIEPCSGPEETLEPRHAHNMG